MRRQERPGPAGDLEGVVAKWLCDFLGSEAELFAAIEATIDDANDRATLLTRSTALSQEWISLAPPRRKEIMLALIDRATISPDTLKIHLCPQRIVEILSGSNGPMTLQGEIASTITITLPA